MEMIVRVAIWRYKEQHFTDNTADAIQMTLDELIFKHAHEMNGEDFRHRHCYDTKVHEIIKKNEQQIQQVY